MAGFLFIYLFSIYDVALKQGEKKRVLFNIELNVWFINNLSDASSSPQNPSKNRVF